MDLNVSVERIAVRFQTRLRRNVVNRTVIPDEYRMQRKQKLFVIIPVNSLSHNEIKRVAVTRAYFRVFDVSLSAITAKAHVPAGFEHAIHKWVAQREKG